jgi:adenylylsulfate kinase-like enzyme
MSNKNIEWHEHYVSKQECSKTKPSILWFTGLTLLNEGRAENIRRKGYTTC